MGVVIDSWVWGGRIVAAVASALLVLPAWWGLLGLAALTLAGLRRSPQRVAGAAAMGLAFAVVEPDGRACRRPCLKPASDGSTIAL